MEHHQQYAHTAKVRRRRASVGWFIIIGATIVGASLPMISGGTLLCLLVVLFGMLLVMEAHRGA